MPAFRPETPLAVLPLRLLFLAGLLAAAPAAAPAAAQGVPPVEASLDVRLLRSVYSAEGPLVAASMRGADASWLPVFVGAAPALALGALVLEGGGADLGPAYRLALAEGAAVGAVIALKHVVRRPRPYEAWPEIAARRPVPRFDSYSFPSGHAAGAFALATSLSLSYPEWYVIAPAATWAASVALARSWLGVHYPSDVLAGALLGSGVAVAVHLLAESLAPASGEGRGEAGPALVLLRIGF